MRIGLNTFLFNAGFTDADIPLLKQIRSYGAEVVELAIVEPEGVTASRLLKALRANELERPVVCGAFTQGRDLRGTEETVARASSYISKLIELTEALGGSVVCGPMYSETGRAEVYSTEARDKQLTRIADALKPLCKKAESAGVVLAVEPLNRFETDCINTLNQAAELIDRVGSPALKIHIDTFHMNIEEDDSAAAILAHAKHIGHVHASASHRGLLGSDQVDWKNISKALATIGYSGDVIIESFASGNKNLAKATSIWRQLYDSPEQLATEGLDFLQATLNSSRVLAEI